MQKRTIILFLIFIVSTKFAFSQAVLGNTSGISPSLLNALEKFAKASGRNITVNWTGRTSSEQQALWNKYSMIPGAHLSNQCGPDCTLVRGGGNALHSKNSYGKWIVVAKPGNSPHERGVAADVNGLSKNDCALLNACGLCHTVQGEIWHVELGTRCIH